MATKPASALVVEKDGRDNQDKDGVWLVREKLTSSIKDKLSKLPPNPTGYCIYKVPERLKANNKDAFTPYVVSIGPFHHQDPRLKAMEDNKLRWLREFFKEHNSNVFATVDFVVRNEATIRQHYEDLGPFSSEEFCEMILLDSIFILGLLLKKINIEKQWTEHDILHDMMLIENQLPLFVPRTIYSQSVGAEESFNNLVYKYFFRPSDHHNTTTTTPSGAPNQGHGDSDHVIQLSSSIQSEAAHFIEYLRMSHFEVKQQKPRQSRQRESIACCSCFSCSCNFCKNMEQMEGGLGCTQQGQSKSRLCSWFSSSVLSSCFFSSSKSPRSAKELSEAGVTFLQGKGGRLNNIGFDGGVLEIPRIEVNELTETLFRNLIAFEQCKRLRTRDVCDYIVFMHDLINTSEDVDILSDAKIIKIYQHDSEWVSNLFNNLYRENISDRKSVHDPILKELKKYNKDPWHQWKAKWYKWKQMLKNDYFKSPWSAISLIAATILLILTVIQTACSIIGL